MSTSTEHSVASFAYYFNPFWSDSTDPLRDEKVRVAARSFETAVPLRKQRIRTSWISYIALWVLDITLIVASGGQSDAENPDGSQGLVWLAILLAFTLLFALPFILWRWVKTASAPYEGAVEAVREASRRRYEIWRSQLQAKDAVMHSQVMLWHQGQQQIELQRQQLQMQSLILLTQLDMDRQLRK